MTVPAGFFFCNKCHRQVVTPTFMKMVQAKGTVKIACNYCKNGQVVIQGGQKIKENSA